MADDRYVVADEHQGEASSRLNVLQQIEDLRLDRYIEGRDDLVADEQFGLQRQGSSDGYTLALAAGELARQATEMTRVKANFLEQTNDGGFIGGDAMDQHRFADQLRHRQAWVQRAERILEDILDPATQTSVESARVGEDSAVKTDFSRRRAHQSDNRARYRTLAAAAFKANDIDNIARDHPQQKERQHDEAYFGKVVFAGSHENAVLALVQGTVDVAANSWTDDSDSNLTRMISKGMLKNADGTSMKYEDFRIIAKSDVILNGPLAYLSDLPPELKAKINDAFFKLRTNDKAAADKLYDGKLDREGWAPAKTEDWNPVVDLVKFVDSLRRKN